MKRKFRISGEFPKTLIKFFEKKEYAEAFIEEGRFRAGLIDSYREIESESRQDQTEGEGRFLKEGMVTETHFSKNPDEEPVPVQRHGVQTHHVSSSSTIFLFCCCNDSVDVDQYKKKFGRYAVKIHNPVSLAIDIDYSLNGIEASPNFFIQGANVVYNKGALIKEELDDFDMLDLAFIQKPPVFQTDHEFRYCLIGLGEKYLESENLVDHIDVNIGNALGYVKLIN